MKDVDWRTVKQERYKDSYGFSCSVSCSSRGRKTCDCNLCAVYDMMFYLACPFCEASCGSTPDSEGEELVRNWMGKHLAHAHRRKMEAYFIYTEKPKPENTNEYADRRFPAGYQYTS